MKQWFFRKIFTGPLLLSLIGVAWVLGAPVHAAGTKASGSPYKQLGKVDDVILKHDQIVIGDRAYVFSKNVTILSGDRVVSKPGLVKGMRLGFNSTTDKHRSVITEIWILPAR